MAFFLSHVISTRDAHISQRAEGTKYSISCKIFGRHFEKSILHPPCNATHIITPPCNTDQIIIPLEDMTCCISN